MKKYKLTYLCESSNCHRLRITGLLMKRFEIAIFSVLYSTKGFCGFKVIYLNNNQSRFEKDKL